MTGKKQSRMTDSGGDSGTSPLVRMRSSPLWLQVWGLVGPAVRADVVMKRVEEIESGNQGEKK